MTITPTPREAIKTGGSGHSLLMGGVIVIALVLYSAYWLYVSHSLRKALETQQTLGRIGEVTIGWDQLRMGGFPYRIEARLTAPRASAPQSPEKWSWDAGKLIAELLPYDPRHVVLKIEGAQDITYTDVTRFRPAPQHWHIETNGSWASHVAVEGSSVGRLALDIDELRATRDTKSGPTPADSFRAGRLQLHTRPAQSTGGDKEASRDSLDFALQGDDVSTDTFGALPFLGPRLTQFVVQARLRHVPGDGEPSPTRWMKSWAMNNGSLAISDLLVKWGPLDMSASGELTLDAHRRPQGRLDAEIANYGDLVNALVDAGRISKRDASLALAGLGLVSQFQGNDDGRLNVPVIFAEGRLYLGPMVVARLEPLF